MPDMTMCHGTGCEQRRECWRYKAPPDLDSQSYFAKPPVDQETGDCRYRIPFANSQPSDTTPINQARRKLAMRIAETIRECVLDPRAAGDFDLDEAVNWIASLIPSTTAEIETELDGWQIPTEVYGTKAPEGPSPIQRLKDALGMPQARIKEALEAAVQRLNAQKDDTTSPAAA